MSLVGPRPPLPREVDGYDLWHRRRLSMKPGITGLWQVRDRHAPDFDAWVEADLEYIDRWSLWLDVEDPVQDNSCGHRRSMKQILIRRGQVTVEDVPAPTAEPGSVLVHVAALVHLGRNRTERHSCERNPGVAPCDPAAKQGQAGD